MDAIDLRSDTVTRPSPAMREAMVAAEVGDDVYGEDPSVNELQGRVAELLGHEAALFVPSGTMANQVAIRAHTEPGDELILEAGGHSFNFESGATSALSGVQVRPVVGEGGVFTAAQLEDAIWPAADHFPKSRLVCVNTHNMAGGTVWPIDTLREVADLTGRRGLSLHLDGARLFNASVASALPVSAFAGLADSVSICLSKGLGAPVGSVLAGSRAFIDRAHRFRKQFGGGMRQSGILAAAGLYALQHNVARLADDHHRAAALADGLKKLPWVARCPAPQTNIVMAQLGARADGPVIASAMERSGVLAHALGPRRIRLVTHMHISDEDVQQTLMRLQGVSEGWT